MPQPTIVRLQRTDPDPDAPDYVVVSVESNGPSPLDLKIFGTDSETEFKGAIRQNRLDALRESKYDGTPAEWQAVLGKTLLAEAVGDAHADSLSNLECVATVTRGKEFEIVWRRTAGPIIQRLGTLVLRPTEDEIDLFVWSAHAADATKAAQEELEALNGKLRDQQRQFEQLKSQLEDLTKAKDEHENALLQKFCELLNSKKLKIRDQQRLLASAVVDPQAAKRLRNLRDSPEVKLEHKAQVSRVGKRKATKPAEESDSDSFERAPDRESVDQDRDEVSDQVTPARSDAEETSDEELAPPAKAVKGRARRPPKGNAQGAKIKVEEPPSQATASSSQRTTRGGKAPQDIDVDELPPSRDLPFAKSKSAGHNLGIHSKAATKAAKPASDSDTESDDEL